MENRALLVGINKYPGAPLNGCVNDVTDVANYLTSIGFKTEEIRLLVDERATTANIVERLNWLIQVKPGARVLFWYSGHGAQIPTRGKGGEVDNLYECLCPVDFDWTPERMLIDKQLVAIFKKLPKGVKFNWVSDSCHSGDLDRSMSKLKKWCEIIGHRFFPMPVDIAWRFKTAKGLNLKLRNLLNNSLNVGFVSGCKSNGTSADGNFNNKPNGALTYFLLKNLKSNNTLKEVVDNTIKDLIKNGFSQRPTVDGPRVNLPFLG